MNFVQSLKSKSNKNARMQQRNNAVGYFLCGSDEDLSVSGYTRLSDCPEVQMAVNYIAELISSMTIYLMENTDKGDVRVKNALSRKIDICPNRFANRKEFMYSLVKNALLSGNQYVYPRTVNGYLEELIPLPGASCFKTADGYAVRHLDKVYTPDEILHFRINPDSCEYWRGSGYTVALREVTKNLKQASHTKNGFMSSKWKPSIIVKVDGLTEEFSSMEGRSKLLESYIETSEAGQPWLLPADQFEIEQVKPLSLNDLAINDAVLLDKKTVAKIIGVPFYVVGAGEFNKEEHRNFINTKIMPIAQIFEQEFTNKLLISDKLYFKLSSRALYGYDLKELSETGMNLYVRGIVTGNEVRDWINMTPKDGLDERVILENYIPAGMIGEQKKLNPKGGEN